METTEEFNRCAEHCVPDRCEFGRGEACAMWHDPRMQRKSLAYPWWTGFRMRMACRFGIHRWADIVPNVLATSADGVTVCVFGVCTCRGQAMAVRRA